MVEKKYEDNKKVTEIEAKCKDKDDTDNRVFHGRMESTARFSLTERELTEEKKKRFDGAYTLQQQQRNINVFFLSYEV